MLNFFRAAEFVMHNMSLLRFADTPMALQMSDLWLKVQRLVLSYKKTMNSGSIGNYFLIATPFTAPRKKAKKKLNKNFVCY